MSRHKYAPVLGPTEWEETLNRLVEWANSLNVTKREAFNRIADLLGSEHFGVEHSEMDNFEDISPGDDPPEVYYLNMGDTYSTTLLLTDDYLNGETLQVSCWGDWYEENERHHCEQSNVIRCGYCGHFTPLNQPNWHDVTCDHCNHKVDGSD